MERNDAGLAAECMAELGRRGWKAGIADAGRLDRLEADILDLGRSGAVSREQLDYLLGCWDFGAARAFPGRASLVVVACPSPPRNLVFAYRGASVSALLPPVFAERESFQESALDALRTVLDPAGHRVEPVALPAKLLAARTGLARIGRNRIAYVEGMGSFARLAVFAAGIEAGGDPWMDVLQPERCRSCGACERACPPRILKDDGRPLPFGKCICYLNEEVEEAFPADLDPAWHNAVIGCMRCQEACPLDAPFAAAAGPSFDEAETGTILGWKRGDDAAGLPETLARKLAECGLLRHLDLLPRNLGALLRKKGLL